MAQVEITAMTFGPYGIGHLDGKTVMVPNAAPGDLLEVEIESEHRDYAIARLKSVVKAGPERRPSPCPFLPRCGGCDWQQLNYRAQVLLKAQLIATEIGRALGVTLDPAGLVEPTRSEFAYRSRIRLKTGAGGALGFRELSSNALVEIDRCLVAIDGMRIPNRFAAALGGNLREIEVARDGAREVLIAHLSKPPRGSEITRAREVMKADTQVAGIVIRDGHAREVLGDPSIMIELEPGLEIRVDADLFTQVNHEQNRRLIEFVMDYGEVRERTRMLDLFCGSGNFSLPAARRGAEVLGVDAEPLAVAAAAQNASRLGFESARFTAMRAAQTTEFLLRARYRPELVIVDPPRSGAASLMATIARLKPARVAYVSCDLTTLARDLRALARSRYKLERLRAFDFFPNTHHIEIAAFAVLT
jgi:23S rRNA (uracil1939-C5)-methyltransferase